MIENADKESVDNEIRYWKEDEYGFYSCSGCGFEFDDPEFNTPYCPECGAKMYDEKRGHYGKQSQTD